MVGWKLNQDGNGVRTYRMEYRGKCYRVVSARKWWTTLIAYAFVYCFVVGLAVWGALTMIASVVN